jgi:hypothetical protein
MSYTLLLYGATGYSGRLIAAEAAQLGMVGHPDLPGLRMVLAGRDHRSVGELAKSLGMEARVFGLDDRDGVQRGLTGVDVVINAAGPFALTANALAKAALSVGCHYVDINGEAEVYMKLDDLGRYATSRQLAMVSGAGHTAAASDLMVHAALTELGNASSGADARELGAVRMAMGRMTSLSRGSADTLWRSLREQVRVVRKGKVEETPGQFVDRQVLWHEPVGKLERAFDFYDPLNPPAPAALTTAPRTGARSRDPRIASATNLVDTLTARLTVNRHGFSAHRIESYVEAGTAERLAYQFGPLLAPFAAMSWARELARLQLSALPAGPTPQERRTESHFVVLTIEDLYQNEVIDWGWHTPNPYDFTARIVLEVASTVVNEHLSGWLTPSDVLKPTKASLTHPEHADERPPSYLRGCQLTERRTLTKPTAVAQ